MDVGVTLVLSVDRALQMQYQGRNPPSGKKKRQLFCGHHGVFFLNDKTNKLVVQTEWDLHR